MTRTAFSGARAARRATGAHRSTTRASRAPRALRAPRTPLTLALTAAAAALAAAFAATPLAAPPAHAMGVPRTIPDQLTVSYDDGAGHGRVYQLACTRFSRDPACVQLERMGGPVPDVAADQACPMIYGGPERAEVTGTWNGRTVSESYRRTNGCEVARWNRMIPALPAPGPETSPGPLVG